jgi:hypothetical protein
MRLEEMHQFMRDNVVDESHGQLQEPPVEEEDTITASPSP